MVKLGLSVFCMVVLVDGIAAAQTDSGLMSVAQMLAALVFVLCVLFSLAWILRRLQQPGVGGREKYLQVVDSINLGLKEKLVVVQVGKQKILLGVTPSTVSKIQQLPDQSEQQADPGLQQFSQKLQDIVSRGSQK